MIDIETLKEYIRVLEGSSLAVLELSDDEERIRLEKPIYESPVVAGSIVSAAPVSGASGHIKNSAAQDASVLIKSPMVGVFYSAPAPDKPDFISVGDTVSKGDIVCVIEAMKIMNEITADKSGTISEILVNNGDVVEFDQPLFKLN